ncbi:MAG: dTMP kinase [Candidatus Electryonea clarkiae]|nr:dTMP kinase [Candidatus Electryonea clarkiae]MDP8286148.1 dTMP kinase [Candidatus Electryonea clarkiae]
MKELIEPDDPMRKGALIVFEGIDGCGKTTQAGLLMSWLKEKGIRADYSFEPTDGQHGRKLRESFLGNERLSIEEELELFRLDRIDHVNNVILPGLREGWVLIVDRYYYSSIAYQGDSENNSYREIYDQMTSFSPIPDAVLLFDIDAETAIQRISVSRGDIPNLMEKRENLIKVKAGFDSMDYPEIIRIDASKSLESIYEEMLQEIQPVLSAKKLLF